MEHERPLQSLSDDELLRRLADLLHGSRRAEADIVAHIGEVDLRRLFACEACPSMFVYCTERLHLSEAEAYLRIAAARAAREHPMLLGMLADGRLHLSAITRLAPHLTLENREAVLGRAAHMSKRRIEELVAELAPRPDVPALVRKLPDTPSAGLCPDRVAAERGPDPVGVDVPPSVSAPPPTVERFAKAPARPAAVEPLAPGRFKTQFTASAELRDKLERLRALMRSSIHDGDLAAVIESAVTEKLQRLEARRFARTNRPRRALTPSLTPAQSVAPPSSRHIPAAVRREVHERDGGRCRYRDAQGRRCSAREGLEFHHRHPYGHGGGHSVENLCLMCRAHNSYLGELDYGARVLGQKRTVSGRRPRSAPVSVPVSRTLPEPEGLAAGRWTATG